MTARQQVVLQQHPLSAAFPAMPEADLKALAEDIKKNGQREKGVLLEGMVLDGWHRYLACKKVGEPFIADDFEGDDPQGFVLSVNENRRHSTKSERAASVVRVMEWRPTGRPGKGEATSPPPPSNAELARAAGTSERTIQQAKAAERIGLGDEVRDGKLSAQAAANVAKLPKAKREKAVKAIKEGRAPKPPKEPKPKADDGKLRAELIDVQGRFADLLEKNAELADTARDLSDKLVMFETTEPDEQQKLIATLQKKIVRLDGEIDRLKIARNDCQNKNNELVREVKRLKRKAGE